MKENIAIVLILLVVGYAVGTWYVGRFVGLKYDERLYPIAGAVIGGCVGVVVNAVRSK